jgi:hypothetical protein
MIDESFTVAILRVNNTAVTIMAIAQGEAEFENEFRETTSRWKGGQMSLVGPQKATEENLLLGPTKPLLADIQDTHAALTQMNGNS